MKAHLRTVAHVWAEMCLGAGGCLMAVAAGALLVIAGLQ